MPIQKTALILKSNPKPNQILKNLPHTPNYFRIVLYAYISLSGAKARGLTCASLMSGFFSRIVPIRRRILDSTKPTLSNGKYTEFT